MQRVKDIYQLHFRRIFSLSRLSDHRFKFSRYGGKDFTVKLFLGREMMENGLLGEAYFPGDLRQTDAVQTSFGEQCCRYRKCLIPR